WIALHLSSPTKFWIALTEALERTDLQNDPRFNERINRINHHDDLIDVLAPIFRTKTRSQWCDLLTSYEVPHSAAYEADEIFEDPQAKHLELAVQAQGVEGEVFQSVRAPYNFNGVTQTRLSPPPLLDQHGDEIRRELRETKQIG